MPIQYYLALAATLFCIGVTGVLIRRNAIIIFMCIELMLNAVNLLLVAFSTLLNDGAGQVFVFFIMAVAAAEVAVGLAILVMMYRNTKTIDINISTAPVMRISWTAWLCTRQNQRKPSSTPPVLGVGQFPNTMGGRHFGRRPCHLAPSQ